MSAQYAFTAVQGWPKRISKRLCLHPVFGLLKSSARVRGAIFFRIDVFSDTSLFRTYFRVRRYCSRLIKIKTEN